MPLLNQVLFLVAASVFLSPASFDYTLQSLYIPWAWIALRLCLREPAQRPWPFVVMALFAVELAPMTFVQQASVPLNGLVKGAGLLCLLVFAACVPMQWEVAEEVSERLAA